MCFSNFNDSEFLSSVEFEAAPFAHALNQLDWNEDQIRGLQSASRDAEIHNWLCVLNETVRNNMVIQLHQYIALTRMVIRIYIIIMALLIWILPPAAPM